MPRMGLGLQRISKTYRHVGRYRQILAVMVRYGFGEVLDRLELDRYLELWRSWVSGEQPAREDLSLPERIRMALEDLGPTFVKIGQLLSTRPDLVSLEVARELEKLQDAAPPFPGEQAKQIVEEALGVPIDEAFTAFEREPFAAASLGQVHGAVLRNGREVVVKVQRPGIRRIVEVDLEILEHLARIAERHMEDLTWQRPTAIVDELRRALEKEMDYTTEAAHLKRFARMFEKDPGVRIPKVYLEWTRSRVITMERLHGEKVTQIRRRTPAGFDRELVARRGAEAVLSQIFLHGFFHADPHPGNVLVLPDNVVAFLDLGQVGRISREVREQVAVLLATLLDRNEERAADILLLLTQSDAPPFRNRLEADLAEFLDWHLDRPVGELEIGRMLADLLELLNRHQRRIPQELFLVIKSLATIEGLARELDPSFDLASCARPVLERLARERLSPQRVAHEAWSSSVEFARLVQDIPGELREILEQVRRGRLHVTFEHEGLGPVTEAHELAANRLSYAIVLAALIVGSSLLLLGEVPPLWQGVSVVGIFGFLMAGGIGLALLWSIFRRGRL